MVTWLRRILLAAVVVAAAAYLVAEWPTVGHTLAAVSPLAVLGGELALLAAMAVATRGWQIAANALGGPVSGVQAGEVCLVGQLGKYLPGSVWAYLLQAELGRRSGIARTRVLTASLVQLGISLVVAFALGLAVLPRLLWLLPAGLVLLHPAVLTRCTSAVLRLLRRAPLPAPLTWPVVARVACCAVATYTLYGVHLWLLSGADLLLCTGAMAVGLNAGLLLFVLPSGAGLRDVVVAAVLATTLGPVRAAAFAVLSRLMFTVGDLAAAGIAAALARHHRPASTRSVGTPTSCTPRST